MPTKKSSRGASAPRKAATKKPTEAAMVERIARKVVKSVRSDLGPLLKSSAEHAAGQRLRELEKQRLPALRRGR